MRWSVPRDLETIVLEAIEREPQRRYQTAAQMSDDLRRFMEDRPISARRVGVAERCWRWCRRNPAVASLSAVLLLLLIGIAAGSTVMAVRFEGQARQEAQLHTLAETAHIRADEARTEALANLQEAERQKDRAETNFKEAERQRQLAETNFRQARLAVAQLDHPNIIPVYDVGEQQGLHYFSMKLVEGSGNLAQDTARLAGDRPAAVRLLATVARAVHYAHQHGIIHRDLKPANILLCSDHHPFITDFGLAKRTAGGR
jgi:tRNA A-37 threonylcarbamoyl transferase component Bud32